MPNWVENTITISAEESILRDVRARLEKNLDEGFFWQIVHPKEEEMDDYRGVIGSNGKSMQDPTGWYQWNLNNWGCKWDASDLSIEEDGKDVIYHFNTPWSIPNEAMEELARIFPTISIYWLFTEEQGWGGKMMYEDGDWSIQDQWDIPETHADRIKYLGYCWCENGDDTYYSDCPKVEVSV